MVFMRLIQIKFLLFCLLINNNFSYLYSSLPGGNREHAIEINNIEKKQQFILEIPKGSKQKNEQLVGCKQLPEKPEDNEKNSVLVELVNVKPSTVDLFFKEMCEKNPSEKVDIVKRFLFSLLRNDALEMNEKEFHTQFGFFLFQAKELLLPSKEAKKGQSGFGEFKEESLRLKEFKEDFSEVFNSVNSSIKSFTACSLFLTPCAVCTYLDKFVSKPEELVRELSLFNFNHFLRKLPVNQQIRLGSFFYLPYLNRSEELVAKAMKAAPEKAGKPLSPFLGCSSYPGTKEYNSALGVLKLMADQTPPSEIN